MEINDSHVFLQWYLSPGLVSYLNDFVNPPWEQENVRTISALVYHFAECIKLSDGSRD